jgi:integrase
MVNDGYSVEITVHLRRVAGDAATDVQQTFEELYDWMIEEGKNPRRKMGIGEGTAENYIARLDQLFRFTIDYTESTESTDIQDDQADKLLLMIDRAEITTQADEEYSESAKRKFANTLEKYFAWRYHEGSMEYVWEPKIDFSDGKGESAYRFSYRELGLLFENARSYGSLPSYYDTPEEERETIDGLVAQRLGIPQDDVTRNDWLHADWSRKVHAMVTVAYDAGLAPIEIANAETHWYNPKKRTFTIPTEFACKQREKEEVGLSETAADALSEWFKERRHLEKYDGSNKIWLNREGNPYQSGSLCKLIRKLCEEAGVRTDDRKVVWYSLRQTMGNKVTDEGELSEANDQLRHERLSTTQENYNRTPVEKLQARLTEIHNEAEKAASDPDYNPFEDDQETADISSSESALQSVQDDDTNEAISPTKGGGVHVDAVIPDTTEARVDITHQLLNQDADD